MHPEPCTTCGRPVLIGADGRYSGWDDMGRAVVACDPCRRERPKPVRR